MKIQACHCKVSCPFQPKNNNNGKPQMVGKRLFPLCLWCSGVFANTIAFTQTLPILIKTSGLGGCCYVPFSSLGPSSYLWAKSKLLCFRCLTQPRNIVALTPFHKKYVSVKYSFFLRNKNFKRSLNRNTCNTQLLNDNFTEPVYGWCSTPAR